MKCHMPMRGQQFSRGVRQNLIETADDWQQNIVNNVEALPG